jgi:hypothetical protein
MFTQQVRPEESQGSRSKTLQLERQKYNLKTKNLVILIPVVERCSEAFLFSPSSFSSCCSCRPPCCYCATALTWLFVVSPIPNSGSIAPAENTLPHCLVSAVRLIALCNNRLSLRVSPFLPSAAAAKFSLLPEDFHERNLPPTHVSRRTRVMNPRLNLPTVKVFSLNFATAAGDGTPGLSYALWRCHL